MRNIYRYCKNRSDQIAIMLVALGGWGSLRPYFFWGDLWVFIIGAAMAMAAVVLLFFTSPASKYRGVESWSIVFLTIFIIYITLQPRMNGGHAWWIFALPTLWALALFTEELRKRCFLLFASIFTLSIIPSILVWFWVAAGFPLKFNLIPTLNPLMGAELLTLPGVIFNQGNSMILPWGGVLFRLCGIYDEPGTVGTISALILAALHFRLNDWRGAILYGAGIMSFSLAFMVLAMIGLIGRAIFLKKITPLFALIPLLLATLLTLGLVTVPTPTETQSPITVTTKSETQSPITVTTKSESQSPITVTTKSGTKKINTGQIRQTTYINNRTLPEMQQLVDEYWNSNLMTIMFGIASDASVVRGGVSQVWTRILTNHGVVGFSLLLIGSLCYAWAVWRRLEFSPFVMMFFVLFALSFYQRPVIWMPYALLIMLCGPFALTQPQNRVLALANDSAGS